MPSILEGSSTQMLNDRVSFKTMIVHPPCRYDADNSGVIDRAEMRSVMKSVYAMLGESTNNATTQIGE